MSYVGLLALVVWLACLSCIVVRQGYLVRDHELRLAVQVGMTLPEATQAWGKRPGGMWAANTAASINRIPKSFRSFRTGRIVLYSCIWPSSYLWVHVDDHGVVDRTFFIRS